MTQPQKHLRGAIPSGHILGRLSSGTGQPELISLSEIIQQVTKNVLTTTALRAAIANLASALVVPLNVQVFTANTNYTPSSGMTVCFIEALGAGGNGNDGATSGQYNGTSTTFCGTSLVAANGIGASETDCGVGGNAANCIGTLAFPGGGGFSEPPYRPGAPPVIQIPLSANLNSQAYGEGGAGNLNGGAGAYAASIFTAEQIRALANTTIVIGKPSHAAVGLTTAGAPGLVRITEYGFV